jgi:hypothetical protein
MKTVIKLVVLFLFLITGNGITSAQGYIPTSSVSEETPDTYCEGAQKLFAAYDTNNFSYIKKIEKDNQKDPFYFTTCKLLEYSAKLISPEEFVEDFPNNKSDYDVFTTAIWLCSEPCKIFGDDRTGQPIFPYYKKLFELMAEGNRMAIKKVLNSVPWSDGEVAEALQNGVYLPDFFSNHADVVLKNWDLFKNNLFFPGRVYEDPKAIQKLKHMKIVVLKAEANPKTKNEFLRAIDKELKSED